MKQPSDLKKSDLVTIVEVLQGCLYLDEVGADSENGLPPFAQFWNPDKTWEVGMFETLAEVLQEHDLVPDQITPATAARHRRRD